MKKQAKANQKKWKIEGAEFERLLPLIKNHQEIVERCNKEQEVSCDELWNAIYEALPELDKEKDYALNDGYLDLGIIFVREEIDHQSLLPSAILEAINKAGAHIERVEIKTE